MGSLPFCHISLTVSKPKGSEYPKELKTLGDHLRKRRLDLKLLQKDVGQRIGGSVSDVWNWENNRVIPAVKFIPAIIAFLGYNPMPKPEGIPAQLVWYRKGKGWTQKVFARALGVDQSTLAGWERAERLPTGDYMIKVSTALNGRPRCLYSDFKIIGAKSAASRP
jgi:transcriptional regulator with XRE-family HTH domain